MESSHNTSQLTEVITNINNIISVVNELKVAKISEERKHLLLNLLHSIVEPIYDAFPDRSPTNPLTILHDTQAKFPLLSSNQTKVKDIEMNLNIINDVMKSKRMQNFNAEAVKSTPGVSNAISKISQALQNAISSLHAMEKPSSSIEQENESLQTKIVVPDSVSVDNQGASNTNTSSVVNPQKLEDSLISILPDESLLRIMSFLSPRETMNVSQVARRFREIGEDAALWRIHLQQDFNVKDTNLDEIKNQFGSLKLAWLTLTVEAGAQSYLVINHNKMKDQGQFDPLSLVQMGDRDFLHSLNDFVGIYSTKEEALSAAEKNSTKNSICYVCAMSEKKPEMNLSSTNNIYRTEYTMSIAQYNTDKKDLLPPVIVKLPSASLEEKKTAPKK